MSRIMCKNASPGFPDIWHHAGTYKEFPMYIGDVQYLPPLFLFFEEGEWIISWSMTDFSFMVMCAKSRALHPVTVFTGEWQIRRYIPDAFPEIYNWDVTRMTFEHDPAWLAASTYQSPLSLYDLGIDYFLRLPHTCTIWFIDPNTQWVFSSGPEGREYCNICNRTFEGNQVESHLVHAHRDYIDDAVAKYQIAKKSICDAFADAIGIIEP